MEKEERRLILLREYRDIVDDFKISLNFGGIEKLFKDFSPSLRDIATEFILQDEGLFKRVRRDYVVPVVIDGHYYFLHINFRVIQNLEKWYIYLFRFGQVAILNPNTDLIGTKP